MDKIIFSIKAYLYKNLMEYMIDDDEFCLCGCSSIWHNTKRLIIKIIKIKNEKNRVK